MDEAKRELVRAWLLKAAHDLASARKLAAGPDPYLDTACYHCQQAAEKVIKGFLVFHDHRVEKTHDVEFLLGLAMRYDATFSACLDAGARLTPFATAYRYPGDIEEPEPEEFDEALADAELIDGAVLAKLPGDVHP